MTNHLATLRCLDDCDGKLVIVKVIIRGGRMRFLLRCSKCDEDYIMTAVVGLPVFVVKDKPITN